MTSGVHSVPPPSAFEPRYQPSGRQCPLGWYRPDRAPAPEARWGSSAAPA